jgi:putative adenylate-forming enzyme
MLILIANAQRSGQISIHPKRIFSIAETLDPLDQKRIESAFGQKVHQIYQCTEGFLGASCSEGTLHLNEDCVRIEQEWLDAEKSKFIPIITDFTRTSQPIIRYRLNDILTLRKEPCPCGSAMIALECIEGRSDDILYFSTADAGTLPVFPDFIRRAVLSASHEIEEYLVRQRKAGTFEIHLITQSENRTAIEFSVTAELNRLAATLNGLPPSIYFHANLPPRDGKKLRRVLREA